MCVHLKIQGQKYTKQKLIEVKRERDKYTIIHGVFNTPLSVVSKTSRQKIRKDIKDLEINTTL